jgi:hypothetical protein
MFGCRHWRKHAAELDDVPVAVVPIVQQRKILSDLVDGHNSPRPDPKSLYRIAGGRKRYGSVKMLLVPA